MGSLAEQEHSSAPDADCSRYADHAAEAKAWWIHAKWSMLDLLADPQDQVRLEAIKVLILQQARRYLQSAAPAFDRNGWRLSVDGGASRPDKGLQPGRLTPRTGRQDARDQAFYDRVRTALIQGTGDGHDAYRALCVQGLGEVCAYGDEEVLLCLGEKLSDCSDQVCMYATSALARLGGKATAQLPGDVDFVAQADVQLEIERAMWRRILPKAQRRLARDADY